MDKSRPFGITFISDLLILYATLSLIGLFNKFLRNFGIDIITSSDILSVTIQGLSALLLITAAIGCLKLKSWGFWMIISIYSIYIIFSFIARLQGQGFNMGIILVVPQLVYLIYNRKYFMKRTISCEV